MPIPIRSRFAAWLASNPFEPLGCRVSLGATIAKV
jgi:hypothetical protein